jgi:hypothetical protein
MIYRIRGIDPAPYRYLFGADAADLAEARAVRIVAACTLGFPCRVSLTDAEIGEGLILVNHVSHDVETPYRSSYAIYVREAAETAADFVDELPPVFANRLLGLRAFDGAGMLSNAALAMPRNAEVSIRALLADEQIAYIDAHNAAQGCFAARIERFA